MDFIRKHTYLAGLSATAFTIIFGIYIVAERSTVSPTNVYTWGTGTVVQGNFLEPLPHPDTPASPVINGSAYTYVSPFGIQEDAPPSQDNETFDWDDFVAELSTPKGTSVTTGDSGLSEAYAFIPTEYFTPIKAAPLQTESQKALYSYGTNAGGAIQTFERLYPNPATILTDHMQDQKNPAKIQAMKKLGMDLAEIGDDLDAISNVPAQMKDPNSALAKSYREIGANLGRVPDSKSDAELLQAIEFYNASADRFVQKFVTVAQIFRANNVTFTENEPGSVFMFPSN